VLGKSPAFPVVIRALVFACCDVFCDSPQISMPHKHIFSELDVYVALTSAVITQTRLVPDFGFKSGKSGIWPFFANLVQSGFLQISSQIWRLPSSYSTFRIIMEKTNSADQSSGVFTILIGVTRTKKLTEPKRTKIHCCSRNFIKN